LEELLGCAFMTSVDPFAATTVEAKLDVQGSIGCPGSHSQTVLEDAAACRSVAADAPPTDVVPNATAPQSAMAVSHMGIRGRTPTLRAHLTSLSFRSRWG